MGQNLYTLANADPVCRVEVDGTHFDRQWTDTSGNGYPEFDDQGTEFLRVATLTNEKVIVQSGRSH